MSDAIRFTLGFEKQPGPAVGGPPMTYAGVRIETPDHVLTERVAPDDDIDRYDETGDLRAEQSGYIGEHVVSTLLDLVAVARTVVESESRFPEETFSPAGVGDERVVVSYLDADHVRVAVQDEYGGAGSSDRPCPSLDDALGVAVPVSAFVDAVEDAVEQYVAFARACGWDPVAADDGLDATLLDAVDALAPTN